ncbi:MAG: hypothetical protein CVU05_06215 [Bacteroidetes bacterium HGW-Bacteroidetes-21]|jgi:2-iminobutanoate/2-iminopropanoate deaminase|nr:MAG: hypothetical protein CVU05_06215 [Bacteroidetes bacterium HGW-Bacteroidetes-21]
MKKVIFTENAPKAVGPYSQAIEANGMLFVSGQLGINPATGVMAEGIEAQTTQVLTNMKAILEAAGYSMQHVVKCTCLLKDMNDFKAMNGIYAEFFTQEPPARAAYGVARLPLDGMIEIEAIAVK